MKRNYDFIVGIGAACSCSQALREARLQFASLPFDWVFYSDVRVRANLVRDDFADWLAKDALEEFLLDDSNKGAIKRNIRTGIVFPHDFHKDQPFEEEWERVSEKYRRRIDRLSRLIAASKHVLVVWIDVKASPPASDDDCAYVLDVFRRRWPGVTFEMLLLRYEVDRTFANRTEHETDGIRIVTFDYRDYGASGWIADFKAIGRWLAHEYSVIDYRTPEEKANGRRLAKVRRYARFRATGLADYLRTKLEYKLFIHLRKRLERKGLA